MTKVALKLSALAALWLAVSCDEVIVPQPKKPLSKEILQAVLYDISIFNAIRAYDFKNLSDDRTVPMQYIYQKYRIDSLQLLENINYYAANPKQMREIYASVISDLEFDLLFFEGLDSEERLAKEQKHRQYGPFFVPQDEEAGFSYKPN